MSLSLANRLTIFCLSGYRQSWHLTTHGFVFALSSSLYALSTFTIYIYIHTWSTKLLQNLLRTSPTSASSMGSIGILAFLLLAAFVEHLMAQPENPPESSRITVVGVVYCDTCSSNSFSRHSYFLPGAEVNIQCKFKANSPKTSEVINLSVNRTTDKNGVYNMGIPNVDGVNCLDSLAIASSCQASLIGSSNPECNVFGLRTTTEEISIKSKQDNLCIYNMNALNFRPSKRNTTLCGNKKHQEMLEQEPAISSLNSSKCFWPLFPPYGFPFPPLSSFPFPPLPPLPHFPFPSFPFPNSPSSPFPSLPFPFPPLPPFPSPPPLFRPPPPAFNLGDPRTWIPNFPSFSPPPPPAFSLGDPRTWIPHLPPSPPNILHNEKP